MGIIDTVSMKSLLRMTLVQVFIPYAGYYVLGIGIYEGYVLYIFGEVKNSFRNFFC